LLAKYLNLPLKLQTVTQRDNDMPWLSLCVTDWVLFCVISTEQHRCRPNHLSYYY